MDISDICIYTDDVNDNIDKSSGNVEGSIIPSVYHGSDQRRLTDKDRSKRKRKPKSKIAICSTPKTEGEAYSRVQAYLEEKKILKLFNFLIGHLLVEEPPDPIRYLENILKECVLYRSGMREPPLLFKTRHIRSMFQSLGPDEYDTISLDKYKIGMTTLGICPCDSDPSECECTPGRVNWHTFEREARRYLDTALDEMIGKKRSTHLRDVA